MKVSSEPSAVGYWSSSAVKSAVPQPSTTAPRGAATSGPSSPAVIVDVRSTIKNMQPGMAYDLFGRSEVVDLSNAMPKGVSKRGMPVSKLMDSISAMSSDLSEHAEKLNNFARDTFGVAKNEMTVVGGATYEIMLDAMGRRGIRMPEMSSALRTGGGSDPREGADAAKAHTGSFSISRSVQGELSTTSFVAFDRGVDVPDDQKTLVDLDSGDATASGLWASILSGPLASALSSTDQPSMVGMRRYAVTNGKSGSEATVAAVLFARDGEGGGVGRALDLYSKFKALSVE